MNLKQMVARVMRAMPAAPPGVIGELDIQDMLNDAQKNLARLSSKPVTYDFDVTADMSVIPFPTDLLILRAIFWESDNVHRELYPAAGEIPVDQPLDDDDEDASTEPTRYYTLGHRIMIRPEPEITGTISFIYVPEPVEMENDDDVPDLEGSENYLIAYTLHRLHLEANSAAMQWWEMEKMKEEQTWLMTTDQNYRAPFQANMQW